jgi:autotransporter-associated beta strand protein
MSTYAVSNLSSFRLSGGRSTMLLVTVFVVASLALSTPVAMAATYTWSGSNLATWNSAGTNWDGASGTPWDSTAGASNIAVFNSTTSGTTTVDSVTTNGISFSRATTLTGGSITLAGLAPSMTSSVASVINSAIAATNLQININTTGTPLSLGGSNTLSGTTFLASTLNSNAALNVNSLGALGSGAVSVGGIATDAAFLAFGVSGTFATNFTLNGAGGNSSNGRIRFSTNNVVLTGSITLNGNSRITGANFNGLQASLNGPIAGGTLALSGGNTSNAWTFNLGGTNTFTGGLTVGANLTVRLTNPAALNSTVGQENSVALTNASSSRLNLNGNSVVIANLTGGDGVTALPIVRNASATPATLTVGNGQSLSGTFGGILEDGVGGGALSLTKAGSGSLTLAGPNTFTGATTVSAGTLKLDVAGAVGSSSGLSIASGASLDVTALEVGLALGLGQSLGGAGSILGDLVFGSGSKLVFSTSDTLLMAGGTASFFLGTPGSRFGIDDLIGISASTPLGTYTLISGTVDMTNLDNFGAANAFDLGDGKTAYFQQGSLQVVVVPEPGTLLMAGLGIAALGWAVRRR